MPGYSRLIALLLPVLLLTACGGDGMDDLRSFVDAEQSKQKGTIEPLPEIKPYETFTYNAGTLRDPFETSDFTAPAVGVGPGGNGIVPDLNRPREALEAYPLDSLRMVGTLERNNDTAALIRAQDGTIHRVKPGNYLGQNNGKITQVTDEKVELTEIVSDGSGGWLERQASVALSE
jgi:type IV pilus assembly protein PilP